jgi:phytol kinase
MTAAALALLLVPTAVQLASRRVPLRPETLRKLVHIGAALLALPLPLFLSYRQITVLGLLFAALMAISRRARIFTAVHDVDRSTHGEILFPLGVAVLAAGFPHYVPFAYGVVVLGLADGLAALVGTRYGRMRLPGGKSVWGSATFFAVAVAAALALVGPTAMVVAAAASLTAAEAALRNGFDNLVVPVLGGLLASLA